MLPFTVNKDVYKTKYSCENEICWIQLQTLFINWL